MKKLKLQFGLFFLLLSAALGFLLVNSYRQMHIEETALWVGMSEKVFNQMQAAISDLLNQEDARSFSEYRYFQVLPAPGQKQENLTVSPLSIALPQEDPKGMLGYFQIDPDGSFSTPYLPPRGGEEKEVPNFSQRKEREKEIENLTQSLRQEVKREADRARETKKVPLGFVDLEKKVAADKTAPLATSGIFKGEGGAAQNIYPNPLLQPKIALKDKKKELEKEKALVDQKMKGGLREAPLAQQAERSEEAPIPQKLARREMAPSPAQLKAFEEQKQAEGVAASKTAPSTSFDASPPSPAPLPAEALSGRAMDSYGKSDEAERDLSVQKEKRRAPKVFRPKPVSEAPPKPLETYHPPSLLIDPFQARLVSDQYLIFYRKIWVEQKMYTQGFVVKMAAFYEWLMDQSFANSDLLSFAWARLELGNTPVAQYGVAPLKNSKPLLLFERALGYPLNAFLWKVYAASLPQVSTRLYLNLFTGIIILLVTIGLYFIYRSAAAQVFLSQKRQDFVSAVTHELKTPLTSIRMYSEMLQEGWVKEDPKRQEYYRHISQESGRLSHLIDNVLQLARLEKRNYKLNLKKECPKADFERMGEELKKMAKTQDFELSFRAPENLPAISYDPEALKEVLLIFFDNSVKFSRNGFEKNLEMALQREGDFLVWSWTDRGPGIPNSESHKVFEKFYRVENELTRSTKGTGIGLAMAKMIVEAMGGTIEAASREGGGLVVRMKFPIL